MAGLRLMVATPSLKVFQIMDPGLLRKRVLSLNTVTRQKRQIS